MRRRPRQSFAARRRLNKVHYSKFQGHVPWNFVCSACKRASAASALQQAASPRENARIFEKRVGQVRHAENSRNFIVGIFLNSLEQNRLF